MNLVFLNLLHLEFLKLSNSLIFVASKYLYLYFYAHLENLSDESGTRIISWHLIESCHITHNSELRCIKDIFKAKRGFQISKCTCSIDLRDKTDFIIRRHSSFHVSFVLPMRVEDVVINPENILIGKAKLILAQVNIKSISHLNSFVDNEVTKRKEKNFFFCFII